MNFNPLDDETAKELDRTAKKLGETRGGLIRKALRSAIPAGPDGAAPSGSARFCDGTNWTLVKTRNVPIIDSKTLVTRRFCKYGRSASAEEKHGMQD
jgi:hypothetical protein